MIKPRHDQLLRKALENPIVAHELLETHLPKDLFALIDMGTLKLEKESFIESDLSNSISDVLFSAKFNDNDGYIHLLLEHQSKPDHFMAFRLFKYMINICDRHLRTHPKAKQLLLVYPMVIYNGKKNYNVARNLWKLFSDEVKARQFWIEDHKVVNVHDIPDEELKKRAWSGILEFFLKHIHERDLLRRWQEIKELIPELIKIRIGYDYLETVLSYTLTYIEEKDKMVGAGIAGAMEAYYTYITAQKNSDKIRITVYESHRQLSSTTVANIVPGLTPGEITGASPKGLTSKLQALFNEPKGIRVDDVPSINPEFTEHFKREVEIYDSSTANNSEHTNLLWSLGQKSMELWQAIYDEGDSELQKILEESNFAPCREPKFSERVLHDGYKIYLLYGISNAEKNQVISRTEFYKSLGYNHSTILSPQEVKELDPSLANFCETYSKPDGSWNDTAIAGWRPGGCIDTQVFLPKFYEYMSKKMGKDSDGKDLFQLKLDKQVVEVGFNSNTVLSLKFASGKVTSQKHHYLSSTYVFCPGEAVGTLKKLGFEEPAHAGIAGASLMLNIPLTDEQQLEFLKFNTAIVIARSGIGLSCQARLKGDAIFIGIAGAQAFYGDQKPDKDQAFCKSTNLSQLNIINDVFPQFVSLALGWDTRNCELTQEHLTTLEENNIAKRWVGTRAITYDGFPTLGVLYKDGTPISNARTTTGLGSGGASFGPICAQISQASLSQALADLFVSKVLQLTSSMRCAGKSQEIYSTGL